MTDYLNEIQKDDSLSREGLLCRTQIILDAFNVFFREEENQKDEENKKEEENKKDEENRKDDENEKNKEESKNFLE